MRYILIKRTDKFQRCKLQTPSTLKSFANSIHIVCNSTHPVQICMSDLSVLWRYGKAISRQSLCSFCHPVWMSWRKGWPTEARKVRNKYPTDWQQPKQRWRGICFAYFCPLKYAHTNKMKTTNNGLQSQDHLSGAFVKTPIASSCACIC